MNGTPSTVPTDHHAEMQRPPQISQALLQGALEISAIFERRVTDLRADYENTIRALVQERDALLARSNANTGPEVNGPLIEELEALRMQSESWRQERAQLERTLADYTNERANSAQERTRLEQECEKLRQAREELQNDRTALLQECGRIQSEKDIKLQESQEIITAKDASIQELEARVRWLESMQAASPSQPPTVLDQNQFDPVDIFQSPLRLEAYATMSSTLGTMTPIKSPSLDSVPMQVDDPPAADSPPRSPTFTLRGAQSPSVARSPTMFSVTATSHSSTTATRRLVIRVPPSVGPARKPIKSPVSPSTAEELRMIVHVRSPSQDSSDAGSPTKPSSDTSTSSPGSESSSSSSSAS
ncbi:uncharacterized protein TRAVEDRAFT_66522 [Trametes versicolor FP-101664 SS1]|uniref:uncharacterized protein n=1 Tax=Trametes versicolor (strain FP-101664) TaxID=717944 RepID=UPI0004623026|nr:uncharacterized protein TRAVEDRAFT_66522 [Trametes versicolor FP-101664 SS1]EIW55260.1 hypothetical protein TRAVEDRAFT_66522 [Trametes versicolor FP-101664 SS1]